ncbi:PSD1 and planctomycete cytochrome C domain-containing protein [bacterium]|nr:PSD1 and planctomycete cytochrome C domain-containing protein [bacterium]
MRGFVPIITIIVTFATGTLAHAGDELSFNRDIRPILSDTCFFCHGPDSEHREADLRLDTEELAKQDAIVPGDAGMSELFSRITTTDPNELMPPPESGKHLNQKQIDLLKRWIDEGAIYEPHWSYVSPKPQSTPDNASAWSRDPVDDHILAKLPKTLKSPSPDSPRHTLIRRVTFDLTGLPPTQQQIEAFVGDTGPLAYQKAVDRLLASPTFGERMATYWLDLVRYADTVGYHGDQDHNISPYRDYVIDSFNDDLPLDEFTRHQLAGDLLNDPTPSQRIATGYNRLLQTTHEGGLQPKEYLAIYAADRIRNVSAVWMGATVGCAQCHDHKYDPYSSKDFYSMVAFFADIDEQQHFKVGSNSLPTKRPPEIAVGSRWQRERAEEIESQLTTLQNQLKTVDPTQARIINSQVVEYQAELERFKKTNRLTMVTQAVAPRQIRVLPRGNWLDESGPIVDPAIPEFLGKLDTNRKRATRLDLANWLLDVDNGVGGLTARVFVNRFWYLLFGRGISPSLGDFGGQGQPPNHPEMLDQLALDFVQDEWSVKRMMRRLVLSRTYQQASDTTETQLQEDPYNQWFGRQARYRLPAEMVRDNVLTVSDLLISTVGGASVKPSQPAGYYRHLNFPRRIYSPHLDQRQYRRGVYIHWQRQFLHPMLKALDAPSREECTAQRARSNTPLEALVMLNDPSMIDAAVAFAADLLKVVDENSPTKIKRAFELTVSRKPDSFELAALSKLLESEIKHYSAQPQDAEKLLDTVDKNIDFQTVDPQELAAWTTITRALLNLQETVTRY